MRQWMCCAIFAACCVNVGAFTWDFETGTLDGWSIVGPGDAAAANLAGNWACQLTTQSPQMQWAYVESPVIPAGEYLVDFRFRVPGDGFSRTDLVYRYPSVSGSGYAQIELYSSADPRYHDTWVLASDYLRRRPLLYLAEPGQIQIGARGTAGQVVYIDDITVTPIPEQPGLAVLVLGLVSLVRAARPRTERR